MNIPIKQFIRNHLPITHIEPLPIKKNGRVFVTIALNRSGQHAILNWLSHNLQSTIHLNHCAFMRRDFQMMPLPQGGRFITYHNGARIDSGCLASETDKRPLDSCLEALQMNKLQNNLIYSFEEISLKNVFLKKFIHRYKPTILLILRDPYNCLASLFRHHGERSSIADLKAKKDRLVMYLEQALNIENLLEYPVVSIDYGKWICDDNYKQIFLEKVGQSNLSINNKDIYEVQPFGGGSSFDGQSIDYHTLRERVFERWKNYKDNQDYKTLLHDDKLENLSIQFFNFEKPF